MQRSVQVDSFSLVGTLFSANGPKAFFDGTDSDFKKVLKPGETIAGFQISEILPAGVRLAGGASGMDLRVGNGLRREDGGPWKLSTVSATYASRSSGAASDNDSFRRSRSNDTRRSSGREDTYSRRNDENSSTTASRGESPPAAEVNEVLRRLMEQREKENQ